MTTFHDPDFGSMHFDGFEWTLDRRALFNGFEVPVRIEPETADTRELSQRQREALLIALSLPPDVLALSAPAVLQNYEVYREIIGAEEVPPLQAPIEVWRSVIPSSISIPPHDQITTPTFFLWAECDWDPEHGLVVRFRNGYADASNQQGELGLED